MIPIEKAKEALNAAKDELLELSSAPNGKEPQAIIASRLVKEALAALEVEKPAEDAISQDVYNMVCTLPDNINECNEFGDASRVELTRRIQQYAESYHAKKCAECNHEPFARFEARSGITTDVDS